MGGKRTAVTKPLTYSRPQLTRTRRWIFYIGAIAFALLAAFLSTIKESHPSQLLHRKVVLLREATRPDFRFENPDRVPDAETFVTTVLVRPLQLFFTEPIVFAVAFMSAIVFGIVYLFTGALPIVYASYNFTPRNPLLHLSPWLSAPSSGSFLDSTKSAKSQPFAFVINTSHQKPNCLDFPLPRPCLHWRSGYLLGPLAPRFLTHLLSSPFLP